MGTPGTPAQDADQGGGGQKRPGGLSPATPASLPSTVAHGWMDSTSGDQKRARTGDAGPAGRAGVGAGGGGGGGGGGRFDGQSFYLTRLEGEQPHAAATTLSLPELLEPRDRLTHLFIVAGTISPTWMITHGGLANLPSSLEAPPTIIYQNNNDRGPTAGEARPTAKSVLQAASPALRPEAQWEVYQHPKKGLVQHAKLLLLRFGPGAGADGGDGGPGFLRVCIGSSNLYPQWGHSRDVLWIQDFAISTAAPIAHTAPDAPPSSALPKPTSDPQHLRRTLHCFMAALARSVTAPMQDALVVEKTLKQRFAACFAGVDTSHARATVLASIPRGPLGQLPAHSQLPNKWNGIHGLGTALSTVVWPAGAAACPATCLAGSLGDPTDDAWVQEVAAAMTGSGAHALPSLKGETPGLRILYPTNATAFVSDQTVIRCLSHAYYYNDKPFPHRLMWQLEAKPGSWPAGTPPPVHHAKVMYRVAPASLGKATRKAALPGLPKSKSEIRAWLVLGSHNVSKAAWGFGNESPSNFELSVLLLTREPERAAKWLATLPMKLPPEPGLDVPGAVTALRYPADVTYTREAPYAPFTYGRAAPEERKRVRALILGGGV